MSKARTWRIGGGYHFPPEDRRNLPCPICGKPNRLTFDERARGWQCETCAKAEKETDYFGHPSY